MDSNCGNPSVDSDALMTRKPKIDKDSKLCARCKANPGNLVIRHAVFCKDCWIPQTKYKLRKLLKPIIRSKRKHEIGDVLVAFSGGPASTVLLDMVCEAYYSGNRIKDDVKESIWPHACVAYIEISGAFTGLQDRTSDIAKAVAKYPNLTFIPLRLEMAFDPQWWVSVSGSAEPSNLASIRLSSEGLPLFLPDIGPNSTPQQDPITSLRSHLSSLPTSTAVSTQIAILKRLILLYTARSINVSHLLLGTSLTSLSISLISSLAQGGGFVTREEVGETWTSQSNKIVEIVRPMRDITRKEILAYCWWNDLSIVGREQIPNSESGIMTITRDFIINLEKDYPSTISTIARTCGKVEPKEKPAYICAVCEKPAQPGSQEWKSSISIRSFDDSNLETSQFSYKAEESPGEARTLRTLASRLCYSCHTTFTSKSRFSSAVKVFGIKADVISLPVWTSSRLLRDDIVTEPKHKRRVSKPMSDQTMTDIVGQYLLTQ